MANDTSSGEAVFFVVLGLAAIAGGGYMIYDGYQTVESADEVDATVLESSVESAGYTDGQRDYRVQVKYEYAYGGETYTSTKIMASGTRQEFEQRSEAEDLQENYPQGETVTAYVDPDDPSDAFLATQSTDGILWYIIIGVGVCFVLYGGNEFRKE